ncbi:unnamed protein product, partial [marine sediment metagenome]
MSLGLKSEINIAIERLKNSGLIREEVRNKKRVVIISNQILIQIIEKFLDKKEERQLLEKLIRAIETTLAEDKNYLPILAQLNNRIGRKEKAYNYFQKSADNAESIYDYDSALKYNEMVLKYEKDIYPEAYLKTLVKIAHINHITGNNTVAIEYYKKVKISKTKDLLYQVFSGMGRCYSTMEEHTFAVEYLKKAIKLTKQKETNKYIKLTNGLGYSLIYLNKFEEAENIFNESLLLAKRTNNVEMVADTYYYQAVYEWFKNDFNKCIVKAKQNLKFTQKHKLLKEFAYTANLLSSSYQQKGDISQAQKYLDEAISRFKEMKLSNALVNALNNQVCLNILQSNLLKAKESCNNALTQAQQTGNRKVQCVSFINLACIVEDFGRFDEALNLYKKALKIDPEESNPNNAIAMILYKKGEIDKAKSLVQEKLTTKEEIRYFFTLAMIYSVQGKTAQAEKALNKGLELINTRNPDILIKIESFLRTVQFYYENSNFKSSLNFAKKIIELTNPLSKEYNFACALIKIN